MNTRSTLTLFARATLSPQLSTAQSNVSATSRYAGGANTGWLSRPARGYRVEKSPDIIALKPPAGECGSRHSAHAPAEIH